MSQAFIQAISLLWLEVNLDLDEVLWIIASLDGEGLLRVQLTVEDNIAHLDLAHSDPVGLGRRLVRVEQLDPEDSARGDRLAGLALLVELLCNLPERWRVVVVRHPGDSI